MKVFNLEAILGLNKDGFDKGVRDAKGEGKDLRDSLSQSFSKIKTAAKAFLGAAIFKEIIDGAKSLVDEVAQVGDTIDKQSQMLGLSRKAYQEWDYILGQNGASIESLGASMRTLNSLFMSAKDGGEEANDTFAQLGISVHELEKMQPEEQFEHLVRALQKLPAGAQKSALAVKLFGRGGTQLLPLLNQSSDSIDELRARAQELGLIMSDDAVDAAVVYGDSLDDLKRTFNAFKYSIGSKVLPVLTTGIQKITDYAAKLRKAYEEKGFAGVFETLVGDIKNIHWPSWEDVRVAVENAWKTIVDGVKGLAKLVFGENVDGTIDWPTWEEIGTAIGEAWRKIVDGVKNLGNTIGKAVFGENVDGTVDWPTWEEIGKFIIEAWRGIVNGVKDLGTSIGKAVFGENVDGTIKWPTWDDIKDGVESAWRGIVDGVKGLGTGIGKAIFGENVDGSIKWPTWSDIGAAITKAWDSIVSGVNNLPDLIFGAGAYVANDIRDAIQWIQDRIKEFVEFLENPTEYTAKAAISSGAADAGVDFAAGAVGAGKSEQEQGMASNLGSILKYFLSHATGSSYVPYDNYPARLHRGEMVLTASQARRFRSGGYGMDMNALVVGVVGAIREGMDGAQVNSYMDGKRVTNRTNDITGNRLMARRFAPV